MSFRDGIKFEIVPVFKNSNGRYLFPNANGGGQWQVTNPRSELKAIRMRDRLYKGNLRHLCRMMRAWKRTWQVAIKSLLIDTLAYRFIHRWVHRRTSYAYYAQMVRDFFAHLAGQDPQRQHWPALGSQQRVYRVGRFERKAKQCYNLAVKAMNYRDRGNLYSERKAWREIFGTMYP